MSAHITTPPASRLGALVGPHAADTALTLWAQFRRAYTTALRHETSRRNIRALDDRMLADIGVSRAQAEFEADRKPWHRI